MRLVATIFVLFGVVVYRSVSSDSWATPETKIYTSEGDVFWLTIIPARLGVMGPTASRSRSVRCASGFRTARLRGQRPAKRRRQEALDAGPNRTQRSPSRSQETHRNQVPRVNSGAGASAARGAGDARPPAGCLLAYEPGVIVWFLAPSEVKRCLRTLGATGFTR